MENLFYWGNTEETDTDDNNEQEFDLGNSIYGLDNNNALKYYLTNGFQDLNQGIAKLVGLPVIGQDNTYVSASDKVKGIVDRLNKGTVPPVLTKENKEAVYRQFGKTFTPKTKEEFIAFIKPSALAFGEKHDINPYVLMAQKSLETEYGKHIAGNNFGGIKADKGWKGEVQELMTTEYDAKRGYYKTKQPFRLYETPEEGLSDYFNFLEVNKRYAPLKGMKDASTAIDFLAKSGYASDPDYASKLKAIYNEILNMKI